MKYRIYMYLTALALLFFFLSGTAQIVGSPGQQTAVPKNSVGNPFGYYEYLPQNFDTNPNTTERYPVVIFFAGVGELGNGTTDLVKLMNPDAPPKIIRNGRHFPAIIISAQHAGWFDPPQAKQLYDYIAGRYPVDLDRVYVTGLSAGGAGTWKFAHDYPNLVAAIVPVAGATQFKSPATQLQNVPIWAFHNVNDGCGGGGVPSVFTMNNVEKIANISSTCRSVYPGGWGYCKSAGFDVTINLIDNSYWDPHSGVTAPQQKLAVTMYDARGHSGWGTVYNSTYMWDWLFNQSRGGTTPPPPPPPAPTPPVADAGNDIQAILPVNNIILNGSAYSPVGTTISNYLWTKESGPSVSMGGVNTSVLNITNLNAGNYTFRLTVTDANALTAFNKVNVTVLAKPEARAGADQQHTLPIASITLDGSGSYDQDGYITDYDWKLLSVNAPDSDTIVVMDTTKMRMLINFTPSWFQAGTPWNNINGKTSAGTKLVNMIDDQQNSTGISMELMHAWGGTKTGGKTTGNNSGVYTDDVIDGYYWFRNGSPEILISGLDTARLYDFSFFGSRIGPGTNKTTIYTIGSKSGSLNAAENTSQVVKLANVKPNANGELTIHVSKPSGVTFGYLNAIEVETVKSTIVTKKVVLAPSVTPVATDSSLVYVNFTPAWLQVPAPWNNMNGNIIAGTTLNNLKDDQQHSTGINLELLTNWGGSKAGGQTTGNNSGIYNDDVLNGLYWFQGNQPEIKISGLDPNLSYDFTFLGSRTNRWTDKTTIYQIGSKKDSLDASVNTSEVVTLSDIEPDANGEVIVKLSTGINATYGYLNAMVIKTKTAGSSGLVITDPKLAITTVTGLQEGTYVFELTVKDNDGFLDKDTVEVNVGPAVKVKLKPVAETTLTDNKEPDFRYYPNPAVDILNIAFSEEQNYEIRVFNVSGQQFAPYIKKSPGKATIDVSQLNPGYYLVHIVGEKRSKAERVFVAPR